LPSLLDWLSTPVAKYKHYQFGEARKALSMIQFSRREIDRSFEGDEIHLDVWCGQLDLLADDEIPDSAN